MGAPLMSVASGSMLPPAGGGHKPLDHFTSLADIPKPELPIGEILKEAHARWLRPLEVYDILSNYQQYHFKLNKEAPVLPKSGQLYLFDRKEVRYFRKDGHEWNKKKGGKAVQEAHEKLKLGSLEILHCYYAHSEKDDRFQRRCYWMLDEARSRVVLVHYLQVVEFHHLDPMGLLPRKPMPPAPKRLVGSESSQGSESEEERGSPDAVLPSHRPRKVPAKRNNFSGGHKGTKRHADEPEGPRPDSGAVLASAGMRGAKVEPPSDVSSQGTGKVSRHSSDVSGALVRGSSQETGVTKQGSQDLSGLFVETGGVLEHGVRDRVLDMDVDGVRERAGGNGTLPEGDVPGASWSGWQQQPQRAVQPGVFPWEVPGVVSNWPQGGESLGPFPWEMREQDSWQGLPRAEPTGNMIPTPNLVLPMDVALAAPSAMDVWSGSAWASINPPLAPVEEADLLQEPFPRVRQRGLPVAESQLGDVALPTPSGDWSASWESGQGGGLDLAHGWPPDASLWVPALPPPQTAPQRSLETGPTVGAPPGKPPLPPSLPRLRQLKGLRTLAVPSVAGDGLATLGGSVGSPFPVPESPTVVQVLREMHKDAGSRPSSAAGSLDEEEGERRGFEEMDDRGGEGKERQQDAVGRRSNERQGGHARERAQRMPHFEILDCSPEWDFSVGGAKVLIVGTWHLPDDQSFAPSDDFRASITFGGVDVPAEPVGPALRCTAPAHMPGRVPLCVSLGEAQPCSELRDFEYRPSPVAYVTRRSARGGGALDVEDAVDEDDDAALQVRLARVLLEGGSTSGEMDGGEWEELLRTERASGAVQDGLLQRVLLHVLDQWLEAAASTEPLPLGSDSYTPFGGLQNSAVASRPLTALTDVGLSVLHMVAALGYEWAVARIVETGCPVDLKDARGRTALHWAAARGREQVVAQLLTHGAAPGMLASRGGCTPADLAATCGHAGIAAFLAECALNRSLSNMTINEDMAAATDAAEAGAQAVAAATGTQGMKRGSDAGLENALEAVRNAARAAALIQSAYRRRRQRQQRAAQEAQLGGMCSSSGVDEDVSAKEEAEHQAATRIQGAFRSFADRREFLMYRNKVVRLQAAVRGHLQRKKYRRLLANGALDSPMYTWRLRNADKRPRPAGYHVENNRLPAPSPAEEAVGEEWRNVGGTDSNYALERAVTRVQAMVRSRQARAQYLRLRQAAQSMHVEHWQHQHGVVQDPHVQFAETADGFDPSVYLV